MELLRVCVCLCLYSDPYFLLLARFRLFSRNCVLYRTCVYACYLLLYYFARFRLLRYRAPYVCVVIVLLSRN